MDNLLIDFLTKVDHCKDAEEVWDCLLKTVQSMGFNVINLSVLPIAGQLDEMRICRGNYKYDWRQHFIENKYHAFDGYIRHAQSSTLPTFFEVDKKETYLKWDTPTGRVMINELGELGMQRSICVVMTNENGDVSGGIIIGTDQMSSEEFKMTISKKFPTLYGILTHAFNRVNNTFRSRIVAEQVNLTPRQYDILMAMRDGMLNKQIAEKFSIVDATVSFHVSELQKALGCSVNRQIIPRAYELGLFGGDVKLSKGKMD